MRSVLVLCWLPNSGRHFCPALEQQLQLQDDQLYEVGRWTDRSGTHRHYDTAACVSDLAAQARNMGAVNSG